MPSPFVFLNPPPQLLLVDLSGSYRVLDGLAQNEALPTIDVEAVMSQIVECLEAPHRMTRQLYGRQLDEIMHGIYRMAEPEDFEFNYVLVRRKLDIAVVRADRSFRALKLYVQEQLPYDYVSRKHCGYALLRRHPVPTF